MSMKANSKADLEQATDGELRSINNLLQVPWPRVATAEPRSLDSNLPDQGKLARALRLLRGCGRSTPVLADPFRKHCLSCQDITYHHPDNRDAIAIGDQVMKPSTPHKLPTRIGYLRTWDCK